MASNNFSLSDIISTMKYRSSYGSNPITNIADVSLTSSQINNLVLGNNELLITNPALLNHLRNINSSPVSIVFNIVYKTYIKESISEGISSGSSYPPAIINAGTINLNYSPTYLLSTTYNYYGIAVDSNNNYYITATQGGTYYMFVYSYMPQLTIKYTINLSPAFTFNTGTNTFNTGIGGGFNVLNVVNNVVNNVAIDSNNNCYIATTNCIVRVDAVNNIVYPYNVTSSIQNISLKGITIDMNNDIYVTDSGNNQVIKLYSATNYNSFIVSPQSLSLNNPAGIAVDKTGQVCVCDSLNNRVILLSMQDLTEITDYMGQYLYNVSNITVDNNNNHIVNSFVGSVNYDPNFNFISNVSFPQSDSFITAAIAVDNNGTIIIIAPTSAGNGVFTESQLESIEAIYGTSISVILGNT